MKIFIAIIVIALLALIAGLLLPWWSIAIVAFVVSVLLPQRPFHAFLSGFLGIFLLWFLMALFINASNAGLLATRVSNLLGLGAHPLLLVLLSSLVGGLVGGLAALCASYLKFTNR